MKKFLILLSLAVGSAFIANPVMAEEKKVVIQNVSYEKAVAAQTAIAVAVSDQKSERAKADTEMAKTLAALAAKMDSKDALIASMNLQFMRTISVAFETMSGGTASANQVSNTVPSPPTVNLPEECGFMCSSMRLVKGFTSGVAELAGAAAPFYTAYTSKAIQLAQIGSNERTIIAKENADVARWGTVTGAFANINGQNTAFATEAVRTIGNPALRSININGSGNAVGVDHSSAVVKGPNSDNSGTLITGNSNRLNSSDTQTCTSGNGGASSSGTAGNTGTTSPSTSGQTAAGSGGPVSCPKQN